MLACGKGGWAPSGGMYWPGPGARACGSLRTVVRRRSGAGGAADPVGCEGAYLGIELAAAAGFSNCQDCCTAVAVHETKETV